MSPRFLILAGLIACTAPCPHAVAEPLDKTSCSNLQVERKKLLTHDMQVALDQGPDWVKSHLDDADIERVRRFLSIEEQIEFRCRGGGVAKAKTPGPVGEQPSAAATNADGVPLPDRKPADHSAKSKQASPHSAAGEPATDGDSQSKASQALADQDKTAPSKAKATR